jgi:4a-hydroxytetrahydrobiopterin dehydratase
MKYLKKYKLFESLKKDVGVNIKWIEKNDKLKRKFEFKDFRDSLGFINKIATICESMNHHPEINWIYNKIELTLSTHDDGYKITELDYQLANKIDEILTSESNLDSVVSEFINHMSNIYDLRFGQKFDKNKSNCAWFTTEFYNWAKQKSLDVKIVYFDSDIEAHIAPMLDGKVIDFTVKQFTKNTDDDYKILSPEDYKQFGYDKFEVYDELPNLETIFSADRI